MTEIVDDLKSIPGVLGACLYHGRKGVLQTNLPTIFKEEKLIELGKLLMKIQGAGRMNFQDLTDVSIHYDESVVLIRELMENLIVFALCDPSFNQNLVAMSLNLLQQDLKNQQVSLAELTAASDILEPAVQAEPDVQSPSGPSRIADDEMAEVLAEMKGYLPKILGPMAGLIFDDAVEDWKKHGNVSMANLGSLLKLLNEEIGDADKIRNYTNMIAPILPKSVTKEL